MPSLMQNLRTPEEQWAHLYQVGIDEIAEERLPEAASYLAEAMSIAKRFGAKDQRYIASLYGLGKLSLARSEADKARRQFEKALKLAERCADCPSSLIISILSGLANAWMELRKHAKAEFFMRRVLGAQEQSLGRNHLDLVPNLQMLASVYVEMRKMDRGLECLQRAEGIIETRLGLEHPLRAKCLNTQAVIHMGKKEFSKAEDLLQQAKEIVVKSLGPTHVSLSPIYNNLAVLSSHFMRYDQAERYLQLSINTLQESLSSNHPSVVKVMENYKMVTRGIRETLHVTDYKSEEDIY